MSEVFVAKDWHARVQVIGKTLYVEWKEKGRWRQKTTGLLDTPEGRAQAAQLAERMEKKVKADEGIRLHLGELTLNEYAKTWLKSRTGTSRGDDEQRLNDHVLPKLGHLLLNEITTPMVRNLFRSIAKKPSRKGGLLAPRTVINIHGVLHSLFTDAVVDGKVRSNPCVGSDRYLPEKRDKNVEWRDSAVFTLDEVLQLITSPKVPYDRRMFYALMFLGCMRFGEASEARWKDYAADVKPRGKLKVLRSYNTRWKLIKGTKAERPRHVPVPNLLQSMLAEWKLGGWSILDAESRTGDAARERRPPQPTDLIVPSRRGANRSANHMLRRFHQDLEEIGLPKRRQHDARRTWYSTVLAAGANQTHAKWTAHGPPPEIWADYTSLPWETICAVVDGLDAAIEKAQEAARKATS